MTKYFRTGTHGGKDKKINVINIITEAKVCDKAKCKRKVCDQTETKCHIKFVTRKSKEPKCD